MPSQYCRCAVGDLSSFANGPARTRPSSLHQVEGQSDRDGEESYIGSIWENPHIPSSARFSALAYDHDFRFPDGAKVCCYEVFPDRGSGPDQSDIPGDLCRGPRQIWCSYNASITKRDNHAMLPSAMLLLLADC